tara:strand:- start:10142 stop:10303 length:162 start_codon:yes stop_codon:yes gene_type:complete
MASCHLLKTPVHGMLNIRALALFNEIRGEKGLVLKRYAYIVEEIVPPLLVYKL